MPAAPLVSQACSIAPSVPLAELLLRQACTKCMQAVQVYWHLAGLRQQGVWVLNHGPRLLCLI